MADDLSKMSWDEARSRPALPAVDGANSVQSASNGEAVSADQKIKRQNTARKKDSHFRLPESCSQWLEELAAKYGASKAKVLAAILRKKPEPDEFYLR